MYARIYLVSGIYTGANYIPPGSYAAAMTRTIRTKNALMVQSVILYVCPEWYALTRYQGIIVLIVGVHKYYIKMGDGTATAI